MPKELPVFKSDKEAAEFWDKTDASGYIEGGEFGEFVWDQLEDRCDYCGAKMVVRIDDIEFYNGKVTIHKVKKYRCPHCGREKFAKEFKNEIPLITKHLVEMALKF